MFKKLLLLIKKYLNISLFDEVENIVMYICGNETLPSPLEPEEENVLLEELALGNKNAKEKLIEHNLRLVVYIAKKFDTLKSLHNFSKILKPISATGRLSFGSTRTFPVSR